MIPQPEECVKVGTPPTEVGGVSCVRTFYTLSEVGGVLSFDEVSAGCGITESLIPNTDLHFIIRFSCGLHLSANTVDL